MVSCSVRHSFHRRPLVTCEAISFFGLAESNLVNRPHFSVGLLAPQKVQVWVVFLPHIRSYVKSLHGVLSPEESRRAARFAFEQDRHRFILAHGILRTLLGEYLQQDPGGLNFRCGEYGKPALIPDQHASKSLYFNLSHSGDYCLCAVALDREVGVDIEMVRRDVECLRLAERFFTPREYDDLRQAPEEGRHARFYRYWTCKEAYLKARGLGLSSGLERIEIIFEGDGSARYRDTGSDAAVNDERWLVKTLPIEGEVAAAVAAQGDDWEVVVSHYSEPCR